MDKSDNAYKTIGEVAKILNLKSNNKGVLPTHIIRFWETQFKQIKPKIKAGKRRYYSAKEINMLRHIKFLLKEKGLTIIGVKKLLNDKETDSIDDAVNLGVYKPDFKTSKSIKDKVEKILKIIKELKKLKDG